MTTPHDGGARTTLLAVLTLDGGGHSRQIQKFAY